MTYEEVIDLAIKARHRELYSHVTRILSKENASSGSAEATKAFNREADKPLQRPDGKGPITLSDVAQWTAVERDIWEYVQNFQGMRSIRQEVEVASKLELGRSPGPEFLARVRRPMAGGSKDGKSRRASTSVVRSLAEMQRMVDEIVGDDRVDERAMLTVGEAVTIQQWMVPCEAPGTDGERRALFLTPPARTRG